MTAAGRKTGRRYSRESQQEDRSVGQIKERFAELGWPCDRVGRDLGEDLRVRIFDEGQSSGLEFYVQLKSAADAERLKRKKSPALAYRLEVKDLLHWEVSTTLVVLVVWDVEKRVGWWRPVPEIVEELDKAGKGWRKKKTATATVPLANATDQRGMSILRHAVADHCLPIVPKKGMTFSLFFDDPGEGASALRMLARALNLGTPITFQQEVVPMAERPAWYRRIYGHDHTDQAIAISMKPMPPVRAVRMEAASPEGPAVVPYVELAATIQDRKHIVLTNEHQNLPIVFAFSLDLESDLSKAEVRQSRLGHTVSEARESAAFMLAAAAPGSTIRAVRIEDGTTLPTLEVPPGSVNCDVAQMRTWIGFLDKLDFIQQRIARHGTISPESVEQATDADIVAAERMFRICREGKLKVLKNFSFDVDPTHAPPPDSVSDVRFKLKGGHIKVLNVEVPLGDAWATVLDPTRFVRTFREAYARAKATGRPERVHIANLPMDEEYLDWLPGNLPWAAMYEALDHLAELTGSRDGYFTRADARAAGASDAIFDALLTEHKIEPIAADVYHLAHFPHADREDLVVLWLQTDRRGVISHETALHILDLCDILPSHLHVTVPPGWTPQERQLTADFEIRYGEVPQSDLRWLGAVPHTGPLRTVRDCIEVGVSPELIEQAIAEGIRRGLFTEADFPLLRRAESA